MSDRSFSVSARSDAESPAGHRSTLDTFKYDVQRLLHSPTSSSTASTPHQVFSGHNSPMTDSASSHSFTHDVNQKGSTHHTVSVLQSSTSGSRLVAYPITFKLDAAYKYSLVLHEIVARDHSYGTYHSTISGDSSVNAEALQLMVQHVGRQPPSPGTRHFEKMQMDFERFFQLSVVFWLYICKVDHWVSIATQIKRDDWLNDASNLTADMQTEWLFLSLVYDWSDVFSTTSRFVVLDCPNFQEEVDSATFLPEEIRQSLSESRRQCVSVTYSLIQRKYMRLLDPSRNRQLSLVRAIHEGFRDHWNLDLRDDLPRNLYQTVSPHMLLQQLETIIFRTHSRAAELASLHPNINAFKHLQTSGKEGSIRSATRSDVVRQQQASRHSEAADSLSVIGKALKRKFKKKTASQAQDPEETPEHVDGICAQLLADLQELRDSKLQVPTLRSFSGLRSQHIMTEASFHELAG